jgi:hypothetical protein
MKYLFFRLYRLAEKSKTTYPLKFVACNLFFTLLFFNGLSLILILQYFNIIILTDILSTDVLIVSFIIILILVHLFFSYRDHYKKIIEQYQFKEEGISLSIVFWGYVILSLSSPFVLMYVVYRH